MWRLHREENSKTPRMENKRKKILPSFLGMTKPTMVKLGNSFKCSLCKKTGDYPALVPHIQTHARNVMSYRGVQIYRCGLDCAQAPHHHCCFCNKTIINKHCFLRHLKTCDEGNLSPQRSFSCSTPQITAVFHTIPGTTMLQAVTTTSTKATTSIAPGKSQGPATTPFILQAVPSLALQTSVASSSSSSSAALPSQAAAAKQSSTDASSSAKQASESSHTSSLAKRGSTDSASPEKESTDKPEADGSSSHPQQQSPSSESQAAAFIPPLSPLLSTPTKTIPSSSSSSSSSSQPQPTTVRVSVSQQPPTAMSPEHEELEESVLSISDTLHLPTSSTPSPPPIDSLAPLFASEECSSPAPAANAVSSSSYREKSRERVKCPHCPTQLIRRNLKVHINRHHKDVLAEARVKSQFRSLYVDAKNGILAVQRHTHGFLAPVHVQKGSHGGGSRGGADKQGEGEGELQPQGPRCDLRACQQFQQMSERHGLTVSHCQHTRHADPRALTAAEEHLHAKILDEMVAAKILTEAKRAMCLRRQKMAQVAKVPFSVHVDLEGSPKRMFLSVHEPRANDYSCLGRVMVSYDVDSNVWLCPCTKGPMSCLHKSIARWHVFQTHRDLFKPPPTSCARDNKPSGGAWDNMEFGANANGGGGGSSNSTYALNSDVKRSVDYIYEHKRIPAAADLPGELTSTVLEFPGQLFPSETTCGMCGCAPALEEAENLTYQGKIVTMMGVADYVSTFIRRCPMCHMVYRYQEWRDGLHNFNNHLLLSIELCLYFRHSLQNNIPITKAVKTLESLRKTSYPAVETLLTAYSHFEAMMSPDADAHPDCCASPAPVTDLHKKAFLVLHWS